MPNDVRICANCRWLRAKRPLNPWEHVLVWTPQLIKLKAEWQKKRAEIALQEEHRHSAGDVFDYEPETLAWCKAWSDKEGYNIDPVSGARTQLYALCARKNARGDCSLFEQI